MTVTKISPSICSKYSENLAGVVTWDAQKEAVGAVDRCGDVLCSTVVDAVVSGCRVTDSQSVLVHANPIRRRMQPDNHVYMSPAI